ncbi:MAG: hypothetical protein RQ982_09915 [Gammaproteobacteria bacterium]|nr:hypothetical protein [Gammaproteobacteria bacterium]
MRFSFSLLLLTIIFILSSCTPHPASGVWKTTQDNDYGLNKLVVGFDGRASFTTPKRDDAQWHCFWSAADKHEILLDCTPSTEPEQGESFILTITTQGVAELRRNTQLIATLILQDENPSPTK